MATGGFGIYIYFLSFLLHIWSVDKHKFSLLISMVCTHTKEPYTHSYLHLQLKTQASLFFSTYSPCFSNCLRNYLLSRYLTTQKICHLLVLIYRLHFFSVQGPLYFVKVVIIIIIDYWILKFETRVLKLNFLLVIKHINLSLKRSLKWIDP